MATQKLIIKHSNVLDKAPTISDIEVGEIALNTENSRIYCRDLFDNIKMIGETDYVPLIDGTLTDPTIVGNLVIGAGSPEQTATFYHDGTNLNIDLSNGIADNWPYGAPSPDLGTYAPAGFLKLNGGLRLSSGAGDYSPLPEGNEPIDLYVNSWNDLVLELNDNDFWITGPTGYDFMQFTHTDGQTKFWHTSDFADGFTISGGGIYSDVYQIKDWPSYNFEPELETGGVIRIITPLDPPESPEIAHPIAGLYVTRDSTNIAQFSPDGTTATRIYNNLEIDGNGGAFPTLKFQNGLYGVSVIDTDNTDCYITRGNGANYMRLLPNTFDVQHFGNIQFNGSGDWNEIKNNSTYPLRINGGGSSTYIQNNAGLAMAVRAGDTDVEFYGDVNLKGYSNTDVYISSGFATSDGVYSKYIAIYNGCPTYRRTSPSTAYIYCYNDTLSSPNASYWAIGTSLGSATTGIISTVQSSASTPPLTGWSNGETLAFQYTPSTLTLGLADEASIVWDGSALAITTDDVTINGNTALHTGNLLCFKSINVSNDQTALVTANTATITADSYQDTTYWIAHQGIKINASESGPGDVLNFGLDLNEMPTSVTDGDGDFFAVINDAGTQSKLTKGSINISGFNNDLTYYKSFALSNTTNISDESGGTATASGEDQTLTIDFGEGLKGSAVGNTIIMSIKGSEYGVGNFNDDGTYIPVAAAFGGDVSGTYNAIMIADDSHNHIISNVDNLQSALDAKLDNTTDTLTGDLTVTGTIASAGLSITGESSYSADLTITGYKKLNFSDTSKYIGEDISAPHELTIEAGATPLALNAAGGIIRDGFETTKISTVSISTVTQSNLFSWVAANAYMAKFTIVGRQTSPQNCTHITEISVAADPYGRLSHVEYGTVYSNASLATFDVTTNLGTIYLKVTQTDANTIEWNIMSTLYSV